MKIFSKIHRNLLFLNQSEETLTLEELKTYLQEWAEYNCSQSNNDLLTKQGSIIHLFSKPCSYHQKSNFSTKLVCENCMDGYQPFSLHFSEEAPVDYFILNASKIKYSSLILNQPEIRETFKE